MNCRYFSEPINSVSVLRNKMTKDDFVTLLLWGLLTMAFNSDAAITRRKTKIRTPSTTTLPTTSSTKVPYHAGKVSFVAPGDSLELFDDSRVASIYIMFERSHTQEELINEKASRESVEDKLSKLAYQKVVVYTGNIARDGAAPQLNGIIKKANNLYEAAREASASLTKIDLLIKHLDAYFQGPAADKDDGDCTLNIPMPNITLIMQRAEDLLEEERLQNLIVNSNIEENGDLLVIKKNEDVNLVSLADQGSALLRTEIAVDRLEKLFQGLENDLVEKLEMIESMINGRIPASLSLMHI